MALWAALWLGVAFPRSAAAQSAFVSLRPTQDTFITTFAQTRNYGLWWLLYDNGTRTLTSRMMLQFDVSGIPPGAQITSASLGLWHWLGDGRQDRIDLHAVTRPWVEGTGSSGSGVTWLTSDGSTPWATPGGDFNPTVLTFARTPRGTGWTRWDVTALVQQWVNGAVPNHGVLLKHRNENARNRRFHYFFSDESFVPPRLVITYTLPGQPDITVVKAALTSSDPVNGVTNPKAIPGAAVVYSLRAINEGRGAADPNTVIITDPLPPEAALVVTDWSGTGSGPVA
ncbi:MAG: DNRLRE domain-containing protein, partial [Gemmatimonadetes bacterium]|nr:DNRLRE domain-containing protein [Gemmatimonadota bacterium]